MISEITPSIVLRLPPQAPPVARIVAGSAICADSGVAACDNDHNTDTEHDIFFVDMS
jgi:hypothetical protein